MRQNLAIENTTDRITAPLPVKRLRDRAVLPSYQSALAAGMDLVACLDRDDDRIVLEPVCRGGRPVMIPTGVAIAIPEGFEGQVRPRSGLGSRHGVTLPNSPGTIDADYRGEVLVPLINLGPEPFEVTHGLRMAQLVISPVARAELIETDDLGSTLRGSSGFGSTGLG